MKKHRNILSATLIFPILLMSSAIQLQAREIKPTPAIQSELQHFQATEINTTKIINNAKASGEGEGAALWVLLCVGILVAMIADSVGNSSD